MNSCVDLLSPPAWWCGLKFLFLRKILCLLFVTTCVVVWIEIHLGATIVNDLSGSPPAWWCGLKFCNGFPSKPVHMSPPAWWCGLKYTLDLLH